MRTSAPRTSWREMWLRVQRQYDNVYRLAVGKPSPVDMEAELDQAYVFFLFCYHLKDWLKSDPEFQKSDDDIEQYVTAVPALALCADIANSVKHFSLRRQARGGVKPGGLHAYSEVNWAPTFAFDGEDKLFTSAVIYVEHNGSWFPVVTAAKNAVTAWRAFVE